MRKRTLQLVPLCLVEKVSLIKQLKQLKQLKLGVKPLIWMDFKLQLILELQLIKLIKFLGIQRMGREVQTRGQHRC